MPRWPLTQVPPRDAVEETVTPARGPRAQLGPIAVCLLGRDSEGDSRCNVRRATAPFALLPATEKQRLQPRAASYDQRADALGAAGLVRGEGHQVGRCRSLAHVEPAECLRRVGVEQRARGRRPNHLGDGSQVMHHSGLVVDQVYRHDRDIVDRPQVVSQSVEVDEALPVDRDDRAAQVLHRMEHRVMLGRRAHRSAHHARPPHRGWPCCPPRCRRS